MSITSNDSADPIDFRRFGYLAYVFCGKRLELSVLKTCAFYIGTISDDGGPCSRESVEYYSTEAEAIQALANDTWTQKVAP